MVGARSTRQTDKRNSSAASNFEIKQIRGTTIDEVFQKYPVIKHHDGTGSIKNKEIIIQGSSLIVAPRNESVSKSVQEGRIVKYVIDKWLTVRAWCSGKVSSKSLRARVRYSGAAVFMHKTNVHRNFKSMEKTEI